MCLYGCPYGLLWSSKDELSRLRNNQNFEYLSGIFVDKITQSKSQLLEIQGVRSDGTKVTLAAEKVLIAAGPISTGKIVLKSLNRFDRALTIRTSDMYYLPILSINKAKGTVDERKVTLTQSILKILDPRLGTDSVISIHMHGYNELYRELLQKKLGMLFRPLRPLIDRLFDYLFVGFVFLHSDISPTLQMVMRENGRVSVTGLPNKASNKTYSRLRRKLMKLAIKTRTIPIPLYQGEKLPGQSMHFGASFPMVKEPVAETDTNCLGELGALPGVHIVDASVLPEIPAGSYTLTTMANAYCIGAALAANRNDN